MFYCFLLFLIAAASAEVVFYGDPHTPCMCTAGPMREARTSWILPFTAGTFLHIALVTVLPDLLKEENPKESIKQLLALISGIGVMAFVAVFVE